MLYPQMQGVADKFILVHLKSGHVILSQQDMSETRKIYFFKSRYRLRRPGDGSSGSITLPQIVNLLEKISLFRPVIEPVLEFVQTLMNTFNLTLQGH